MAGETERARIFSTLEERFGIQEGVFSDYLLFKGSRSWSLLRNGSPLMAASHLKISRAGMKAFRKIGTHVKPTNRMIQMFGHLATKGKVTVNHEELLRLGRGERIDSDGPMETGYVILMLGGETVVGLGFVKDGILRGQLRRNSPWIRLQSGPDA